MTEEDGSKMTPLGVVCYAMSLLTILTVGVCSSTVLLIMIYRKFFSQIGWRVKAVLMAYSFFVLLDCIFFTFVALKILQKEYAIGAFMCIASAWICVHW